VLLRKMLRIDPSLVQLFGPTAVAESGIDKDIKRLGTSVAELIEKANTAYAAKNGKDLFKATNKTVAALRRIGTPITNYATYKTYIDDLYFMFWESIGSRLDSDMPESFSDVNALRTDLEHDLDHGKPKDVASKRKKVSATFTKYSGAATPATIAPEHFPFVQANVLSALERDVTALIKKI
jgi:hypothetical protein